MIIYIIQFILILFFLLIFKIEIYLFKTFYTIKLLKFFIKLGGTLPIKLGQFIINKKKLEYIDERIPKYILELDDLLYNIIDKNNYTKKDWLIDYPDLKNYPNFKIINSGSIGSVFLIQKNNKKYALKIQHNSILNKTKKQIIILKYLLNNRFIKPYIIFSFDEICNIFLNQFNFNYEGKKQMEFYEVYNNNTHNGLIIPKIFFKNERQLLMEYLPLKFINDNNITDLHKMKAIIKFQIFLKYMFLEEGLLHLDLHSGNWGINEKGLVILDFGYSMRIYDKNDIEKKKIFQNLWIYLNTRDSDNFVTLVINNFISGTQKSNKDEIIKLLLEDIKNKNIFDGKNMYPIVLNFCKKFNFNLSNDFYFLGYYLNFTTGISNKYFKIEKNIDEQTLEELYNSYVVVYKYEDIIFEQYTLFSKYKHINQTILDKLSEKIKKE